MSATLQDAFPLLTLLVWLPILGGVLCLLLGNGRPQAARWVALATALLALALSVPLLVGFVFGTAGASSILLDHPEGFSNAAIYTTGAPPVPEPATWAMMLFGFAIAGYALRRNRRPNFAQLA